MEENYEDEFEKLRSNDKLEAAINAELEISMRQAYRVIEEMGWMRWNREVPYSSERKRVIVQNMLEWHEAREEYERCAFILKGLQSIGC